MKVLIPALLLLASAASFAENSADELNRKVREEMNRTSKRTCPVPTHLSTKATIEEYQSFFDRYKISIAAGQPHLSDIEKFKFELLKIPNTLLVELVEAHGTIHLIDGTNVTEDPTWDSERNVKTIDNRDWANLIGSGGSPIANRRTKLYNLQLRESADKMKSYCKQVKNCKDSHRKAMDPDFSEQTFPTRIVVNRMYNQMGHTSYHGSTNVVLHEQGHALDSIYATAGISSSETWKTVIASEPGIAKLLSIVNKSITTKNTVENFAELFAYYHACDATREHMVQEAPKVAAFFAGLKNVQGTKLDSGTAEVRVVLPEEQKPDQTLFELPKDIIEQAAVEESQQVQTQMTTEEEVQAPVHEEMDEEEATRQLEQDFDKALGNESKKSGPDLQKVGETISEGAKKTGRFLGGQLRGLRRRIGI